jgi:hypothetical protein
MPEAEAATVFDEVGNECRTCRAEASGSACGGRLVWRALLLWLTLLLPDAASWLA